jgi:aryl-alcohol dehydrogenase-like predicted oxidoreductase
MRIALESILGIRYIQAQKLCPDETADTSQQADLYSNGRSEEIIAKALKAYNIPRENVVLMTKCRFGTSRNGEPQLSMYSATINDGRMVNRVGLSRKHIFDAVEASVKRLGTYIDVLQIQRMDPDVPHEEIMKALNDVVERGWVRYLGASSVGISHSWWYIGETDS